MAAVLSSRQSATRICCPKGGTGISTCPTTSHSARGILAPLVEALTLLTTLRSNMAHLTKRGLTGDVACTAKASDRTFGWRGRNRSFDLAHLDGACPGSVASKDVARNGSTRNLSRSIGSARIGSTAIGSTAIGSARIGSPCGSPCGSFCTDVACNVSTRNGSARIGSTPISSTAIGSAPIGSHYGSHCDSFMKTLHATSLQGDLCDAIPSHPPLPGQMARANCGGVWDQYGWSSETLRIRLNSRRMASQLVM